MRGQRLVASNSAINRCAGQFTCRPRVPLIIGQCSRFAPHVDAHPYTQIMRRWFLGEVNNALSSDVVVFITFSSTVFFKNCPSRTNSASALSIAQPNVLRHQMVPTCIRSIEEAVCHQIHSAAFVFKESGINKTRIRSRVRQGQLKYPPSRPTELVSAGDTSTVPRRLSSDRGVWSGRL